MTDLDQQKLVSYFRGVPFDEDNVAVDTIVAEAVRRGQRRQRRRTAARAAQWSCAAVLAATLLGGIWLSLSPRPRGNTGLTATSTSAVTTPAPATRARVTPRSVVRTLGVLLARYGRVSNGRSSRSSTGEKVGTVVLDSGRAPAAISVSLGTGRRPKAGSGPFMCTTDPSSICSTNTRPDGTVVLSRQSRGGSPSATRQWSVTAGRPDGSTVSVFEWNAGQPKGAPAAGQLTPPLTMAQLRSVATSGQW